MRIKGISTRYSQLLEAVDIDSVRKLKKCRPAQLYRSLYLRTSRRKRLVVDRRLQNKSDSGEASTEIAADSEMRSG